MSIQELLNYLKRMLMLTLIIEISHKSKYYIETCIYLQKHEHKFNLFLY